MTTNLKAKVAVALAVYNGSKWLAIQIQSILAQQNVTVKIFISIDPSTDNSEVICEEMAAKDSRIQVLPYVGRLGGASKNFFRLIKDIRMEEFDYLAFADQDDIWFDDKLSRAISCLEKSHSQGYSSDVIAFWPSGKRQVVKKSHPQKRWDFFFEGGAPGCTFVLNKRLAIFLQMRVIKNWVEVNMLDYHDWFTYALARANGFAWFIDNHPSMLYRQHANNHTGVNHGFRALYQRWQKVRDGWGMDQAVLIAKIVCRVDDPFIHVWIPINRMGLLRLALRAYECRRRPIDQVYFFISCIILAITNRKQIRG